jgi:hypothetical protein
LPPGAARIIAAQVGTQQSEILSCQSLDQIAINRAAQKALGHDQAKPRSRLYRLRHEGGNVAGNAGFSAPSGKQKRIRTHPFSAGDTALERLRRERTDRSSGSSADRSNGQTMTTFGAAGTDDWRGRHG